MGLAKDEMMKYEQLGFSKPKKTHICSKHFYDEAIISNIKTKGAKSHCSYCNSKNRKVISFEELLSFLSKEIYRHYDDAANWLPWDEGDYWGEHFNTYELINNEISLETDNELISNEIINHLPNIVWCKKDPFGSEKHEELFYDWQSFTDLLKHKIRYSFFRTRQSDILGNKETSFILNEIASSVYKLKLLKTLKKGTEIYRCRQHNKIDIPKTLSELSSPPLEHCTYSNRMSPAGISMFYGAFDIDTTEIEAFDDTKKKKESKITIGKFYLKEDLQIIDLGSLPETPSIFNYKKRKLRFNTLFLKSFVSEISMDILRDGNEHIEYVPTQVVTEYFRYIVPQITKKQIDGIIYPSTKYRGRKCCVLFFDNAQCEDIFELSSLDIITKSVNHLILKFNKKKKLKL